MDGALTEGVLVAGISSTAAIAGTILGSLFGHLFSGRQAKAQWKRTLQLERERWEKDLQYGNVWWGEDGHIKILQVVIEQYLMPFIGNSIPIDILEIAPGAGRLTAELVPLAKKLTLVDLSSDAIDICRERFKYYKHLDYHVNDGQTLEMIADNAYDLIVSWDSFVHIDKSIVERYVSQFQNKLRKEGIACIHHSARSDQSNDGWRSNMTKELMEEYAAQYGMLVIAQFGSVIRVEDGKPYLRDCTSILQKVQID